MARVDPKNPLTWYLIQIVEYIVVIVVLGQIIPQSTPRWLQVAVFIVVVGGVFVLNYRVIVPNIGRSLKAGRDDES
jgi:ABC-type branched-subunit amino acid transport system permease subunit